MKKVISILFTILFCSCQLMAYEFVLEDKPKIYKLVDFKASELCGISANTQEYLRDVSDDKFAVHPGTVFQNKISMHEIVNTLAFICTTYV
jgi:hypothetical protein